MKIQKYVIFLYYGSNYDYHFIVKEQKNLKNNLLV